MCEEIFGPVLTHLRLRRRGPGRDPRAVRHDEPLRADRRRLRAATARRSCRCASALRHAAGNFYINDKPTGAVVGQQPSAARAPRAPTTRPAAAEPDALGPRGRSRRRSSRRPITAIRTWTRSSRRRSRKRQKGAGSFSWRPFLSSRSEDPRKVRRPPNLRTEGTPISRRPVSRRRPGRRLTRKTDPPARVLSARASAGVRRRDSRQSCGPSGQRPGPCRKRRRRTRNACGPVFDAAPAREVGRATTPTPPGARPRHSENQRTREPEPENLRTREPPKP